MTDSFRLRRSPRTRLAGRAVAVALLCALAVGGCASRESGAASDFPEMPLSYLDITLDGPVMALAVSSDRGRIVAGTDNGTISCMDTSGRVVWESSVATGTPARISTGPGGGISVVSVFGTTPEGHPVSGLTVLDAEGRQLWAEQAPADRFFEAYLAEDGSRMLVALLPWNTGEAEVRFVDPRTGVTESRFAYPPVGDGRIDATSDLGLVALSLADAGDGLSAPDGRTVLFVEGEQSTVMTDSPSAVSSVVGEDAVVSVGSDGTARISRTSSSGWITSVLPATVRAASKLAATQDRLAVVSLMKQEAGEDSRQVIEVEGLDLLTGERRWFHSFVDESRRRPLPVAGDTLVALLGVGESGDSPPLPGLLIAVADGAIRSLPAESLVIDASADGSYIVIGMSDGRVAVSD